jgi:hypothetical protein
MSEDVPEYGDKQIHFELLNLHDAYLNANAVWGAMQNSPIEGSSPQTFLISDRARFERLWWALVAVYLEAWDSVRMKPVRDFAAGIADISELTDLVRSTRRQPLKGKLRDVRGYMFHRDERPYHDVGRFAVLEYLPPMSRIHIVFGKMMLVTMKAMNSRLALPPSISKE